MFILMFLNLKAMINPKVLPETILYYVLALKPQQLLSIKTVLLLNYKKHL